MSDKNNMVDERFELAAVIFRLAGREEYNFTESDYQKEVTASFSKFAEHPAVRYVKNDLSVDTLSFYLGYDAVFRFSIHIEKKDGQFVFIEDIGSLLSVDVRWNDGRAEKFLLLLNDFYIDSNYAEFYNSHLKFFEKLTQKFIDEKYSKIDFEWFAKYVDISNLRCVISPTTGEAEYGATVNDRIIYCLVCEHAYALAHEYCHSFGNPLAYKWYEENQKFKKMCDDTAHMPGYNTGFTIAGEYVTRAYNILYCCQGKVDDKYPVTIGGRTYKRNEAAPILMMSDFKRGFSYIEEVYKMILEFEHSTRK